MDQSQSQLEAVETDTDEWDRSFTAAATVGAIEAIVVWILTAPVSGFASGFGSSSAGIKAAADAFIVGAAIAFLFFIPIVLFGAMAGMCLNVFLRRHGQSFVWALGFILFIVWFAVFPELSNWDQVRLFIQRRITFKIRDLVDTGISMSA